MQIPIEAAPKAVQSHYSDGDYKIEKTKKGFAIWRSSVGNDWYEYWTEYNPKGKEIGNGRTHHGAAAIHSEHDTLPVYECLRQDVGIYLDEPDKKVLLNFISGENLRVLLKTGAFTQTDILKGLPHMVDKACRLFGDSTIESLLINMGHRHVKMRYQAPYDGHSTSNDA